MEVPPIKCTDKKIDDHQKYVLISRKMFQDKRLSPKAKGVLGFMYSDRNYWKTTRDVLMKQLHVGKYVVQGALDELVDFGYCRVISKDKKAVTQYDYEVILD